MSMKVETKENYRNHDLIIKSSSIIAIALTLIVLTFAIYLLVVGQKFVGVSETTFFANGEIDHSSVEETVSYEPYPTAIFPLVSSVFLIYGVLKRRNYLILAWAGLTFLLIFSGLFLFSSGAAFLPVAGLILVCLTITTIFQKKELGQPANT